MRFESLKKLSPFLIVAITLIAAQSPVQARQRMRTIDRIRVAEAFRIADEIGDDLWKGWKNAPFAILLVTPEKEYLIRHPNPSEDFIKQGYDSLLGADVCFRERMHPMNFLATFPAIQGSLVPTIVVGQAESTSVKTSTPWVVTLLHEHFHQWQMSQPGYYAEVDSLRLSHGDQTGMWMLNFPFPYDSLIVQKEFKKLCASLVKCIQPVSRGERSKLAKEYLKSRERFAQLIGPENNTYLSFQLWQEGIARYTEYRMARMASSMYKPTRQFSGLMDFIPFRQVADTLYRKIFQQLSAGKLGTSRRELAYPFGAVEGLLLDNVTDEWHSKYLNPKFFLEKYFSAE